MGNWWKSVPIGQSRAKEFCGILTAYDSNSVTIDEDGTERVLIRKTQPDTPRNRVLVNSGG